MATANVTKTTKTIIHKVDLSLTYEEAATLAVILNLIGGDPDGWRGIADDVRESLAKGGIDFYDDPLCRTIRKTVSQKENSIYLTSSDRKHPD